MELIKEARDLRMSKQVAGALQGVSKLQAIIPGSQLPARPVCLSATEPYLLGFELR